MNLTIKTTIDTSIETADFEDDVKDFIKDFFEDNFENSIEGIEDFFNYFVGDFGDTFGNAIDIADFGSSSLLENDDGIFPYDAGNVSEDYHKIQHMIVPDSNWVYNSIYSDANYEDTAINATKDPPTNRSTDKAADTTKETSNKK